MSDAGCGKHRAFVFDVATNATIGELTDITDIYWDRRRDDISQARLSMGSGCCEIVNDIATVKTGLQIIREGEGVWRGIASRIEWEHDGVILHAEDMLFPAKRRVIEEGWNYEGRTGPTNVEWARTQLVDRCFARFGDHWRMANKVVTHPNPADRQVHTAVNKYQFYVWEVLDNMARASDLDYTVVNGVVHLWDVHTRWLVIDDLHTEHLSEWPRIVEYGNDYANRFVYTDASGYAAVVAGPQAQLDEYGQYMDFLHNTTAEDEEIPDGVPSQAQLASWLEYSQRAITRKYPPPMAVIVPENVTLLPSSPWDVATLIPGSWFQVWVETTCRQMRDWHKLQELRVRDSDDGEQVQISTMQVPPSMAVNP